MKIKVGDRVYWGGFGITGVVTYAFVTSDKVPESGYYIEDGNGTQS